MIALYALGMDVTFIRSITDKISISINSKNCDIHYKYNIKFVCELSSILSVNCLQFCQGTVFKMCVGELSCR